ncbi:tetratricopeptide repeat protein [Caldalkalibacillus uzonensis]|nr:tetratricopeptide repeat protein [Caldalkalibacillus uzonensis]
MEATVEYFPHREEKRLRQQLSEAKRKRNKEEEAKIKKQLVRLYLFHGENFKMAEQPDPEQAEKYLRKALALDQKHPVAHYRLAHLLYRKREYAEAIHHFKKALDGTDQEQLDETQVLLTQMFMVNCGIFLVKESVGEIEFIQNNAYAQYNSALIEKYKSEILVTSADMLERMLYRKISPDGSEVISEDYYNELYDYPEANQVLLSISDEGYEVAFAGKRKKLEKTSFYVLFILIQADRYMTYEDIKVQLFDKYFEQERSEASIRQTIRRLKERLPFWEQMIESQIIDNKIGRRRKSGLTYLILCRASDILPGKEA